MSNSEVKPKGLAQQLLDAQEKVIELINATTDPDQRKELSRLRRALSQEAGRLIDAKLDAATEEYRSAAAGIEEASKATREAIKDVNSIQAAINALAKAVDLASKLAVI